MAMKGGRSYVSKFLRSHKKRFLYWWVLLGSGTQALERSFLRRTQSYGNLPYNITRNPKSHSPTEPAPTSVPLNPCQRTLKQTRRKSSKPGISSRSCTKDCDGVLSRRGWRAEMWKEWHHPSPQVCFFFSFFFFFHTSASEGHSFFSLLFFIFYF